MIKQEAADGLDKKQEQQQRGSSAGVKKPELLIPAGNLETLRTAVRYGADAVYIGGEAFSLRAKADNFDAETMREGIAFAHAHGVKVYVTANIFAHNSDLPKVREYLSELREIGPDALIISDPGIYRLCCEILPEMELHISTQMNNTNYETYRFWYALGAKRVVSARELSLSEIREIRDHIPADMEIESFIHGAMCISYSGRCLLSGFMTGREANCGACTHPCRWKYQLWERRNGAGGESSGASRETGSVSGEHAEQTQRESSGAYREVSAERQPDFYLTEEKRPGEYFPVMENERGTYIFNSKDLCMIGHIPEMIAAGIDSFKIEGRMKTQLYVATVARTYRRAIDDYFADPERYRNNQEFYREEIGKCTYREFTTGFYFGKPGANAQIYDNNTYVKNYTYLGCVEEVFPDGRAALLQKNKFCTGDVIEIMKPDFTNVQTKVLGIWKRETGEEMPSCPHASEELLVQFSEVPEAGDILRVKAEQ